MNSISEAMRFLAEVEGYIAFIHQHASTGVSVIARGYSAVLMVSNSDAHADPALLDRVICDACAQLKAAIRDYSIGRR